MYFEQRLSTAADRQQTLETYKKKIRDQFWTRTGKPKDVSDAQIRSIVTEFEHSAFEVTDVIDLLLYRVEMATDFANQFGGMPESSYTAAKNAFEKALKLMQKHQLIADYKERCGAIFEADNLDYWYIETLELLLEGYAGN